MFTKKIYSAWEEKQIEKYKEMRDLIPKDFNLALDVGVGPGWFEEFFGMNILGIDIDKNSAADIIASGDFIPIRENSFDFVICLDTIHLVGGEEIKRVLKPRGYLLLSHFINKDNENEIEKKLLNMFKEFKLLKRKIVGNKEKDLAILFGPVV